VSNKHIRLDFVGAFGWIPYVSLWRHARNMSVGKYVNNSIRRRTLKRLFVWLICKTGNQDPPLWAFQSAADFREYLKSKEYRAAICIEGIEIQREGSADPTFTYEGTLGKEQIGYTAPPVLWRCFWLRNCLPYFIGEADPGIEQDPDFGKTESNGDIFFVVHKVHFRVDKLARDMSRPAFEVELPFAWIEVIVAFNLATGVVNVSISGSAVPSRIVAWARTGRDADVVPHHDMLWIEPEAIQGFFESSTELAPQYPAT
jgi:hypothetical protein